jgi:hypothetical protein
MMSRSFPLARFNKCIESFWHAVAFQVAKVLQVPKASGKGLRTDLGTKTLSASGTDLKSPQGIGPRFSEDS